MSRCWYDFAVARAALASRNQTQQQDELSVTNGVVHRTTSSFKPSCLSSRRSWSTQSKAADTSSRPSSVVDRTSTTPQRVSWSDSDGPRQFTSGLHSVPVDKVRRRRTSSEDSGRHTGSGMTSSDVQDIVAKNDDAERGRTTLNQVDTSRETRRSRSGYRRSDEQDLAGVKDGRQGTSFQVELPQSCRVEVPRRCRSVSRTRRRALNREIRLTKTTTTTETTTITPQQYHHLSLIHI